MTSFADYVGGKEHLLAGAVPVARGSVWRGPSDGGDRGGVTFSLLNRYLSCKERFRLYVMEGLSPRPDFNHRLEFGNMWHVCEQAVSQFGWDGSRAWERLLGGYAGKLCTEYPRHQEQIDHWHNVCLVTFPVYVDYWSKHEHVVNRTPVEQEKPFCVQYDLPSGRKVYLRGKRDSVDLVRVPRGLSFWLQENKTKGDVREVVIKRQCGFDLQTMLYVTAMLGDQDILTKTKAAPFGGVRYNVVRRPLSGGKGTITRKKGRQGKPLKRGGFGKSSPEETWAEFYSRLGRVIRGSPSEFFFRWEVALTGRHVQKFRDECLNPLLENLLDDYEWWSFVRNEATLISVYDYELRNFHFPKHSARHFRLPFGLRNVLDDGGQSDLDEFLDGQGEYGLVRLDTVFPELGVL